MNNRPDFVWREVPAGRFAMGGDPVGRNAWDGAEYDLPYPFWIAQYPVTCAQFESFILAKGYQTQHYWTESGWADRGGKETRPRMFGVPIHGETQHQPAYWGDDSPWHLANYPVVGVSWHEAYAYAVVK